MRIQTWWSGVCRRVRRLTADMPVPAMLVGSGALMLAGAVVRVVSGSPYAHGIMVRFGALMPPAFWMSLGWLLWYGILGAVFVGTLCRAGRVSPSARADIYAGGMLFLTMIFLGFLWYPLFFSAGVLLLSAILMLIITALCIACGCLYIKCCRPAATVLFCHAAWLVWLCVVNIRILFC